jgi:signal transduction histidine kinase
VEEERLGWRDAVLPALMVVLGAAELAALGTHGWTVAVGLEAVAGGLLVFRRRYPLVVGPASAAALLVIPWVGPQLDQVAAPILFLIVAIYSLARWITGLRGVAGLVVILGFLLIDYAFVDSRDHDWTDMVFVLSLTVPPYVFGRIVWRLDDQRRRLAEQQDLIRDRAVAQERERIARELHDVIAHSLSAMVVQTAAAQDLLRTSPDRAVTLLQSVADTGRGALEETGRLLHLIRDDADELGLRPAPGLRDVPVLVDTFRAEGLLVETEVDLPAQDLPGGIDVSAYRVVQEMLTNALRYADGPVSLKITVAADRLRISCANPFGTDPAVRGSGLGLQGIAERVALLGGTLDRTDDGKRFAVQVDIPLVRQVTP